MPSVALAVWVLLLTAIPVAAADRITIITDAFGTRTGLAHDWGFAALVEVGGKRILFDAGNDSGLFERNVRALKIDLSRLDAVVISHRHGDHTAGLRYLRQQNPSVPIYVPEDEHFGGPTPRAFFRPEPALPPELRYFGGSPPETVPHGSAWDGIRFIFVGKETEILPGVRLVAVVSEIPGFRDLREISMTVETSTGRVVLVGCSHPGIENILAAISNTTPGAFRMVVGGMHLVTTPVEEIARIAVSLKDRWKVQAVAPGHCTGEPAFKVLRELFGTRYVFAGVGSRIDL